VNLRKWDEYTRNDLLHWDDHTARVVWKWGGYATHGSAKERRYPGRIRALFRVILRSLLPRLATVPAVPAPEPTALIRTAVPATAPTRVLTPAHLLTTVRSTAPPARLITSAGRS
jgi:hypothetical protein